MANSSRHETYYVPESTYGETPVSPSFLYSRNAGLTLGVTKTEIQSSELYADRGIRDSRHGNKQLGGDEAIELSYSSHDDILEGGLGGTWNASPASPVTDTTIAAVASGNSLTDTNSGFGSIPAGTLIKIEGFTTSTNNGIAYVNASAAGQLDLDGITFTDEAAGASITVSEMETLKIGIVRRPFSFLRDFTDLTDGRYNLNTGCEVNTISLSTTLDAIITGTFNFLGKGESSSASPPAGSTFGSPTTMEPFVSFDGCVYENGARSGIISAFDWTLSNGLEAKFSVCSDETAQPGQGQADITGNITAYFDNDVLLNKFLNETESSLKQQLTDAAGNSFAVYFPIVKYNGGQPDIGGEVNSTISLPFRALYDETAASAMIVARLDAV